PPLKPTNDAGGGVWGVVNARSVSSPAASCTIRSHSRKRVGQKATEPTNILNSPNPETVMSAAVTFPALTSILRVPEKVPLDGKLTPLGDDGSAARFGGCPRPQAPWGISGKSRGSPRGGRPSAHR